VLDIMLHPSVTRGAEGLQTIIALVRSHFAQGGLAIQFNIFDADLLRDAQAHPERYANLQVRVCGWNVRFVDLAPAEQDLYIAKAEAA
jgi:formate C-acetyltransferase